MILGISSKVNFFIYNTYQEFFFTPNHLKSRGWDLKKKKVCFVYEGGGGVDGLLFCSFLDSL